jgi:diguanylate cyclase (GGDEF)-like protein/PAS domain S-box-containing protein
VLVGAVGFVVLVGWYADVGSLTTVFPGYSPMRPNTAVAFIALGIAVATLDKRRLAVALSAATAALSGATLVEYVLGHSLGIDSLLPGIDLGGDAPRMAPATALSLLLLAGAILAGGHDHARLMRGLAMTSLGVGEVAIVGYAYGVSSLYTVNGYTSMALHTALCVAVLSLSILLYDPSAGVVGLLRDGGSAGKLLRPIVPFLLLGPFLLGWLRLWAEDNGLFDTRFGVGALVMSMTVFGGALSWRAAVRLRELDRLRDAGARALDQTNRNLEATVLERTRELAGRQSFTDAMLETIDVGIVSCDVAGNYLVRNRAQRAMLGLGDSSRNLQPEDASPLIEVLDDEAKHLTVAQYPLMRTLRGEQIGAVDLMLGPEGGPLREVVARGNQIVGQDGAVLGAVVSLTDVTAERSASRALDEEHRMLTEAQRIGQLGSFVHDFTTGRWTFSEQMCALWGVEPGGLVPELTQDLIFDEDRPVAWRAWQDASRLGGRHSYDYRIRRANDGEERLIRSNIEVDLGPDGQPLQGRGTHLDITELTVAEQAAQRANAFFDAVLTATPDFTFVTELATGTLIYVSRDKDVLGMTTEKLEALESQARLALVHPEDRKRALTANADSGDLDDGQVLQLRYRALHVDGQWRWLSRRVTPFRRDDAGAVLEVLGVLRDITDIMEAEDRLTRAALHDDLTGLPNRALLVDRLEAALTRSARDGREVGVLYCDLDGFKRVNDTAGHAAGDTVLLEVARRLNSVLRDDDTVARVGGDEFVIIVEPWNRADVGGPAAAAEMDRTFADRALAVKVAERVAEALREPVTVNGVDHVVTASMGITYATAVPAGRSGTVSADQVLQDADAAMYRAKSRGRDRFEIFEHGLRTNLAERGRVEHVLRRALHEPTTASALAAAAPARGNPTLTAAYQPIFDSGTGALVGFEALARLTDADGLPIAPDVFIAIAEETGTIHPLGKAMLGLACRQLQTWREQTPGLEHVSMAVNVSALQAQHTALGDDVRRALNAHRLTPADLVLELTETALLQAAHSTITTLRALHAEGVGIAIDDFGTGYASLRYLATLPVTAVKVDKSFTAGLPHDQTSRKIVKAVAGLAADLELICIVEGVETAEQRSALPEGVHVQGYLTGRPQPPEMLDVPKLFAEGPDQTAHASGARSAVPAS